MPAPNEVCAAPLGCGEACCVEVSVCTTSSDCLAGTCVDGECVTRVCEGCEIQRVEVEARRVAARARFDAPFRALVALRRDPFASGVVVATHATCEWGAQCRDWSVRVVELE